MSVLLATGDMWPEGEPGAQVLIDALAARGVVARHAVWTDPAVDWAAADLIAVRCTWDYILRPQEFLAWSESLPADRLLNGADVFRWNHHKGYLAELGDDGVAVVPTLVAEDADGARRALASLEAAFGVPGGVVKPAVGAGGIGLVVAKDAHAEIPEPKAGGGGWVVQPLVESISTRGEESIFVIGGAATCQVSKLPTADEVRVHEEYGGASRAVALDPELAAHAHDAWAWLGERIGRPIDYLRVDLLHHDGRWVISELEAIEPGLYLDIVPSNAEPFADLVISRLRGQGR